MSPNPDLNLERIAGLNLATSASSGANVAEIPDLTEFFQPDIDWDTPLM
jgi:hypothetical protein